MTRALRAAMVALVLVNLAFVSITEAARWTWLGPLLGLTLASPWLVRLARLGSVRAAWNLSLLGVFALLMQHAFTVGVAHMLEEGLLLAALCQVHLLNNIRPGQKPDLLFFNSFLIAVVTSFLSIDVGYSVLFLVYAPLLVIGMQLLALSKAGVAEPLRRTLFGGLVRSAVVLAVTMAVFSLWPRDFQRRGLLGERLARMRGRGGPGEVDFTERVDLDRSGSVTASDRLVLRVRGLDGPRAVHWRGATLDGFDGRQWVPSRGVWYPGIDPWRRDRRGWWVRSVRVRGEEVEVLLLRPFTRRLFLPLEAGEVKVKTAPPHLRFQPLHDLTFWYQRHGSPLSYSLRLRRTQPALGGRIRTRLPGRLQAYTLVRRSVVPDRVVRTAQQLRDQHPPDVAQHRFVESVRAYLSARYSYLPPGADGGARTLDDFMSGQKGGHCEYFATALVVMLRSQGVPCRFVSGYRSDEWDPGTRILAVRSKHAHAWVEVLDPAGGWYTVDASPVVGEAFAASSRGLFARARRWAEGLWAKVTGFDEKTRAAVLAWMAALPRRLLWPAAGVLVVGFALLLWRRRREPEAVRIYRRELKRHGLTIEPGETPRRLLQRAPGMERATKAHERARYGHPA